MFGKRELSPRSINKSVSECWAYCFEYNEWLWKHTYRNPKTDDEIVAKMEWFYPKKESLAMREVKWWRARYNRGMCNEYRIRPKYKSYRYGILNRKMCRISAKGKRLKWWEQDMKIKPLRFAIEISISKHQNFFMFCEHFLEIGILSNVRQTRKLEFKYTRYIILPPAQVHTGIAKQENWAEKYCIYLKEKGIKAKVVEYEN